MTLLTILTELASDNSRLAKEAILKREIDNELLKRVFRLALDPTINYYIKKIPANRHVPGIMSLEQALDFLETRLAKREVTGDAAKDELAKVLGCLGEDDAEVLRMVVKRDLRCGVNESTVNKIWKKLIPEFPYQRCELLKAVKLNTWPWKDGVVSQLKADGSFANVICEPDGVTIMTRSGTVYPESCLQNIRADIASMSSPYMVYHGELLVYKGESPLPREISNGKLNSLAKGGTDALENGEEVRFLVWDALPYAEFLAGKSNITYSKRIETLRTTIKCVVSVELIETRIVYSMEEAFAHYSELIERGFEGTIIKRPDGIWKDGTSKEQVKLKIDCDVEVRMKKLNAGNGKNAATFGSVQCESECGKFEVNVSGFKDDARQDLFNNWESYQDGIITIRINNIMKPTKNNPKFSAFLPRFIEHRVEKSVADTLDRIQLQFDSVMKGK